MFIGSPGAGKTTALLNAGLKFPLEDSGKGATGIRGVGGTRNCDWWFTDEAVLIDTAGRYTTQDSDQQRDRAAERASVADAGGDLGGVALDLHTPAAAVAQLAPRHVGIDGRRVELQPGGQALDDAGEAGSVRLPGRDQAQRHACKLRGAGPEPGAPCGLKP